MGGKSGLFWDASESLAREISGKVLQRLLWYEMCGMCASHEKKPHLQQNKSLH